MLVMLSAFLVIGSLMAVVVADDVMAQDQVSLSAAQQQVTTLTNTHRELQIEVSVQQAPQAVVNTAEGQLGMVPPGQITDLPEVSLTTPLPAPQTAPIPAPATTPPAAAASSTSNAPSN
jgi:cell division protein FtsL